MNICYLLIGGNEGDRHANLAEACNRIGSTAGKVLQQSSIYETAPWGKSDQADFLNQALKVATAMDAPHLLQALLGIETGMGRMRKDKYGARIIDIDILFFNTDIIRLPQLVIPHPRIQDRRFALTPMEEIAPSFVHPVLHQTIRELLAICPDELDVKKISGGI